MKSFYNFFAFFWTKNKIYIKHFLVFYKVFCPIFDLSNSNDIFDEFCSTLAQISI